MDKSQDKVCVEQALRLAGCALCNLDRPALIIIEREKDFLIGVAGECGKVNQDDWSTDFNLVLSLLLHWECMTEVEKERLLELASSLAMRRKTKQEEAAHG